MLPGSVSECLRRTRAWWRLDVPVGAVPIPYYNLNSTTTIGAGPTIVANWKQDIGNTWTVPVGIGISKTINIGKVPVRFGLEASYSVIHPDDIVASRWSFRFSIIPAVRAALFKWMQ